MTVRGLERRLRRLEALAPRREHRHILRLYQSCDTGPSEEEVTAWLTAACNGTCPRAPTATLFLEWNGSGPDDHNGPMSDVTGESPGVGTYAALRAGYREARERTNA